MHPSPAETMTKTENVRNSSRRPRIGPREMRRLLKAELAKIDDLRRPERQHQYWRVLAEAFGYVIFEGMFAPGGQGLPRKFCVSAAAALASVDTEGANVFDSEALAEDRVEISQEKDAWFCPRYPGPLAPPDPKAGGLVLPDNPGATGHPAARAPRGPIDALQRNVAAYEAELVRYHSPGGGARPLAPARRGYRLCVFRKCPCAQGKRTDVRGLCLREEAALDCIAGVAICTRRRRPRSARVPGRS